MRAGLSHLAKTRPTFPKNGLDLEDQLVGDLVIRLLKICEPTLVLELNIARLRGDLVGDSAESRFYFYSEQYLDLPNVFEILEEHTALARMMSTTIHAWVTVLLEFFSRLADDRLEFQGLMKTADTRHPPFDVLDSVKLGISDLHNGGRSVFVAADRAGQRIVYKPRSLSVDDRLANFVDSINRFGLRYDLLTPGILEKGDYGWMEYIQKQQVTSTPALHRFYWRQGAWICILHLLRGVDVHRENTIAAGEYPVLVDNETLFHPSQHNPYETGTVMHDLYSELARSVFRQAMLPHALRFNDQNKGIDMSALGGDSGQILRGIRRGWANVGMDDMHAVEADYVSAESDNRPDLLGSAARAADFGEDVIRGFHETYQALIAHRAMVKELLLSFRGATTRSWSDLRKPTLHYFEPAIILVSFATGSVGIKYLTPFGAAMDLDCRQSFLTRLTICGEATSLYSGLSPMKSISGPLVDKSETTFRVAG